MNVDADVGSRRITRFGGIWLCHAKEILIDGSVAEVDIRAAVVKLAR
jgi:hypothetical protein